MGVREDTPPVVPLQSAAGPEHPPCPACSNPLFPWLTEPWPGPVTCSGRLAPSTVLSGPEGARVAAKRS